MNETAVKAQIIMNTLGQLNVPATAENVDRLTVIWQLLTQIRDEPAPAPAEEEDAAKSIAERYWDVFSECFEGVDFNPVSFRYHDAGWDSVAQMILVSRLEEAFQVRIKGREVMRLKSYGDGLRLIRGKLEQTDGGN